MTRRIVIAMALVAATVAIALAVPLALIVARDQRAAFVASLETRTLATAAALGAAPATSWAEIADNVAQQSGARVVVIDANSILVTDSAGVDEDRAFDRPEVQTALEGSMASGVRASQTLGSDLRYVTAPVIEGGSVVAAVRLSMPDDEVSAAILRTQLWLAVFTGAVVIAASLFAWFISRAMVRPLARVAHVAQELSTDLGQRADEVRGPSEVRDVATALNATASRLGTLLHGAQRVAADASHHLRTPLQGVRLRLEAIEELAERPDIQANATAAIEEVDRLARRIDQVLALARSDVDTTPVNSDLARVVTERIAAAAPILQPFEVTARIDPNVNVRALPGSIARTIDELIGNAAQYAKAHIDIEVRLDGQFGRLDVRDDGPGIQASALASVFERFVRGPGARPGGSGLGLALVKEGAEAVGGSAWAESCPEGTCIVVRWPVEDPA